MSDPSDAREPGDDAVDECSLDGLLGEYYRSSSVLELLGDGTGGLPRVFLQEPDGQVAPIVRPLPAEDLSERSTLVRYQMVGEIARGGMGVVLHARDLDLGRDVAMKVLRKRHADKPEMLARFIEEAQIGGQLQHPGIVPIHELGVRSDRRPYFTMKLVKGKTLAVLLAETRELAADRPRFIGIMEKVCQAMAYAHARGVIHRDLKPSNIMVGAFGEVQLLDWGLAKVLRQGGTADERKQERARDPDSLIETLRSGSGSHSSAGSVMGTPAYMPPEQARGEVDRLDERSDVFTLGAILCEVLTGVPPYEGKGRRAREQAAHARLDGAFARLKSCDADPELVELTKSCLSSAPTDRPRSAEELAELLTDYLQSVEKRARDAQIEAAAARRGRKLTLGLAASVLITVVVGGGSWIAIEKQRADRRRETVSQVATALSRANLLRGQRRWAEALAASELAQDLAQSGGGGVELLASVATQIGDLQEEAQEAIRTEEITRQNEELLFALEDVRQPEVQFVYPTDWAKMDATYLAIFATLELDLDAGSIQEVANDLLARGLQVRLAADLDEWALARSMAGNDEGATRLRRVAGLIARDEQLDSVRIAVEAGDIQALIELARRKDLGQYPVATQRILSRGLSNGNAREEAVAVLRRATRAYPGDFTLRMELARALDRLEPAQDEAAVRQYTAALALRPGSIEAWHELGRTLLDLGEHDQAEDVFTSTLRQWPEDGHILGHLGVALARQGKLDEAVESYSHSIAIDPADATVHFNLGVALARQGKLDDAEECYRLALEIDPSNARIHNNLGTVLSQQGRLEEAVESLQRSIEIDAEDARSHYNIGNALAGLGKLAEAIESYRRSIVLNPDDHASYDNLGNALRRQGKLDEAMESYCRAVEIAPESTIAQLNLGLILAHQNRHAEAIECYHRILEIDPESAIGLNSLGWILATTDQEDLRNAEGAVGYARRATVVRPTDADFWNTLGVALYVSGEWQHARGALSRSVELSDGGTPADWLFLALICHKLDDGELASEWYQRAQANLEAFDPALTRFVEEAEQTLGESEDDDNQ